MAVRIDRAELVKAIGDPWTADDANLHPRMSDQVQVNFQAGHTTFGHHRMPAAQACAIVRWTGSAYVVASQVGGVSVVRLGVGRVRITVSSITSWMAVASPFDVTQSVGAVEVVAGGLREITLGVIDKDKPDFRVPIDCSFVFEAYGTGTPTASTTAPVTPRFRIAQDDVLDVELINRVATNALGVVDTIAKEHRIAGQSAGEHNLAPVPLAARLYDLAGVTAWDGLEPLWNYGLWHDDSGFSSVMPEMSVLPPDGCRILAVRAFATGATVDDVLRVRAERDPSRPRWIVDPTATRLGLGGLTSLLVLVHGVRG